MKISGSAVAMSATHTESSYVYTESMTMEAAASRDTASAILSLSKEAEGKDYVHSMKDYQDNLEKNAAKQRKENEAKSFRELAERMRTEQNNKIALPEDIDMKIKMLKKILAILRGERAPLDLRDIRQECKGLDMRSEKYRRMEEKMSSEFSSKSSVNLASVMRGTTNVGTTWQKITAVSGSMAEFERTTFESSGIAKTEDGRSIDFNVQISMSRSFACKIDKLEVQEYIKTDPLMINLDSNVGTVTDQKFYFDLDSDGRKEKISFAGEGSGFLMLDKNGDGVANDGSELFGTQSGDGFADLAEYDEDRNGWIDENDDVFSKLKVWTKDSEGNDFYISLRDADVGAIYLGNAETEFSVKNESNVLNAEIRKTGIYLKESTAQVGTLNHVDLVV